MHPVAKNLKRAYREPEKQELPPAMEDLLRKLREAEEQADA
ncbi:hypothetical protein [Roseovarius aquimarinus]|uniref:Anti-sigma factor NepR domain-containing protein n=1 Tax=Roseovarius aquimarinus TaxID=1229156 RepID=A0ABW7I9V1_9RHOB